MTFPFLAQELKDKIASFVESPADLMSLCLTSRSFRNSGSAQRSLFYSVYLKNDQTVVGLHKPLLEEFSDASWAANGGKRVLAGLIKHIRLSLKDGQDEHSLGCTHTVHWQFSCVLQACDSVQTLLIEDAFFNHELDYSLFLQLQWRHLKTVQFKGCSFECLYDLSFLLGNFEGNGASSIKHVHLERTRFYYLDDIWAPEVPDIAFDTVEGLTLDHIYSYCAGSSADLGQRLSTLFPRAVKLNARLSCELDTATLAAIINSEGELLSLEVDAAGYSAQEDGEGFTGTSFKYAYQ